MQKVNRVLNSFEEVCYIFYFSFVNFSDDRWMKAKILKKTWIKNGEFLMFELISNMYNSYLPVSRRGRNRGGKCRE